ncbi:MAG: DUF255 domain-containing protein [Candidatus Zixiibacteriota bacterium]|nr:MAG: DUF255 domain-containing protein [candidate division Zixibacteria bacterium]
MRVLRTFLFLTLSVSLLALNLSGSEKTKSDKSATPPERKKTIEWHSYDVGIKKAREENKHVFIDFTARWCTYCRKMEREVFSDSTVIDMLNNDFVSIKVDGESRRELDIDGYKMTERNLTIREYGVRSFPFFWFLKPDGTRLGSIRGYRPLPFMVEALTFVKEERYDSTKAETETDKDKGK